MLPGAPSQLLPATPLATVLALAHPGELLGAWVRGCRAPCRLQADRRSLLVGADLGALLRHCIRVAVRERGRATVLEVRCLIAWRTLRIVIGAPCLPRIERLRSLYPELIVHGNRIGVPIGLGPPEEALAACAAARVPVVSTWIDYRC
ncbi:MAG: hypothetical protein ACREL3_11045 [Gemmatimonadales bacterium]